uniref:Rhodopsin domain-containing protein n=1 Tax=Cladonia uncialis subsp. uncialis TaxID=180999 RepID=A0A1Z1C4X6_CLAUC|nr:hypothetical protein [Cladonia uncialis subsp. uncialis]AUW30807.1 hypothetical protein [Cladonia uncialis subsp. uncialis]
MSSSATQSSAVPSFTNENRGTSVLAVFWVETGIAIGFVGGRFYGRRLIGAVGLDDWSMLITLLLLIAASAVVTSTANLGGYRHLIHVPPQNINQVFLNTYIFQTLTTFAFGTSKFSIGFLILRLIPSSLVPTKALWDFTIPATCWSLNAKLANIYVGTIYNIVCDVILAVLPVFFVWKLKMSLVRRLCLSVLLGLGFLAAICGIAKITYVRTLKDVTDVTWINYPLTVWNGSEVFVIILCGSMPALKVLWDHHVKKTRQAPYSSNTYGSTKNEYIEMMGSSRDETTLRTASPSTSAREDGQASRIIATTRIEIKSGMVAEPCDTNNTNLPRARSRDSSHDGHRHPGWQIILKGD